jgi:hypothetical protein
MSFGDDATFPCRRPFPRAASARRDGACRAFAARLTGLRRSAVLVAAALVLVGCQATETYLVNRGLDASDMVRAQVMAGPGVDVKLEVTHFVGLGFGFYDASACGLGTRHVGCWEESVEDFGFWINRDHHKLVTDGAEPSRMLRLDPNWIWDHDEPFYVVTEDGFLPWLSARACLFLFVGAEVEVRGGEILDFAAGLVGLDPSHDDRPRPSAEPVASGVARSASEPAVRVAAPGAQDPGGQVR